MASALNRLLREEERQEKLLESALAAAKALAPAGRRRLYLQLGRQIESEATDSDVNAEPVAAPKQPKSARKPQKAKVADKANGEAKFVDLAEDFAKGPDHVNKTRRLRARLPPIVLPDGRAARRSASRPTGISQVCLRMDRLVLERRQPRPSGPAPRLRAADARSEHLVPMRYHGRGSGSVSGFCPSRGYATQSDEGEPPSGRCRWVA
jgi:hypothetical protein